MKSTVISIKKVICENLPSSFPLQLRHLLDVIEIYMITVRVFLDEVEDRLKGQDSYTLLYYNFYTLLYFFTVGFTMSIYYPPSQYVLGHRVLYQLIRFLAPIC